MTALFGQLDRALTDRTWIAGDRWTITDADLLMLLTWVPDHRALLAGLPSLARSVAAWSARPSVAAALAAHAGH